MERPFHPSARAYFLFCEVQLNRIIAELRSVDSTPHALGHRKPSLDAVEAAVLIPRAVRPKV